MAENWNSGLPRTNPASGGVGSGGGGGRLELWSFSLKVQCSNHLAMLSFFSLASSVVSLLNHRCSCSASLMLDLLSNNSESL